MKTHKPDEFRIADIAETLRSHTPRIRPLGDPAQHAAVAMILREGNLGRPETLFIKRVEHSKDPWSGHMALPGGRMEPKDESLESVARRETFEETHLELSPEMLLGRLDDVDGGHWRPFTLWVTPFVYHHSKPVELALGPEVADVVWVPLSYLGEPRNVRPYYLPTAPSDYAFPSFQYGPYTIWGMTYRILSSFMRVLGIHLPSKPITNA